MDGSMSSAAVEILLQNLLNVFKEEYFLIRDLEKDAQQLRKTLDIIKGLLNDAEKKSITQDAVKTWLRDLEAVAFDADNVLDELSYHLLHKNVNKMKKLISKVRSYLSMNHIARPRNMACKIKEINANFESMNEKAIGKNIHQSLASAPTAPLVASSQTNSLTSDPIFIGRDEDMLKLVEKLTHIPQEGKLSILAIVGMGGIGKTTLTRKVFNHKNIKARFGSHIWIHVSQTFDTILLFKKILLGLGSQTIDEVAESEESILKNIEKALKGKTYLFVLDDVWNEEIPKWEHFINSISGVTSTNGNAIIITTRNDKVASLVKPLHIHPVKGLSDEDCWSIIKAKAFANGDATVEFERIGKGIAKRCQNLPLAANVVGGVLYSKSEKEWRSINENWLLDGEGRENITEILKFSFDHLPLPSLKKCFAYCSIYPKSQKIVKQELIEQWMAERFLQADDAGNDMESVGNMFLNVLIHNSLLLVAERDEYGNVESCVMHDLVHDMASSVLASFNSGTVRYMKGSNPIPKEVAKHLRTLFFKGEISGNMFSDLECLHVLTLECSNRVEKLPDSIRRLIHLRNLNISKTSIEKLPDKIGELHHLQTLRAENGGLKILPSTLKYLINLRHLYIDCDVKLPAEIGRLICLQTLRHFTVGDEIGCRIEELGSLANLKGKLKILSLEKVHGKEEALKANLCQNSNLFDLHFEWGSVRREGESNDESVLEGLQPHANLQKLEIEGFKGKRFPLWSDKMQVRDGPQGSWVPLENLIEIRLSRCEECEEIPTLEHLRNLKSLSLRGLKNVRFINSLFNNLKSLHIEDLEGLECLPDWLFNNNQNLSKLYIFGCPKLRELPDGLDKLNSLEFLTISLESLTISLD